jgi:hypothetical protein
VRDMFSVIGIPNKMHPRSIYIVVEFMKIFQKESLVINIQVEHP